jgi:integrase
MLGTFSIQTPVFTLLYRGYDIEVSRAPSGRCLSTNCRPLHNIFELAKDEWGLPVRENLLSKVRLSSTHARRERRLRNGELANLIAAARTCRNRLILPVILLAVETGMRRGEILSLRWEHIDRGSSSLFIPDTKNGHSRTLPLTKAAAHVIDTVPILRMPRQLQRLCSLPWAGGLPPRG